MHHPYICGSIKKHLHLSSHISSENLVVRIHKHTKNSKSIHRRKKWRIESRCENASRKNREKMKFCVRIYSSNARSRIKFLDFSIHVATHQKIEEKKNQARMNKKHRLRGKRRGYPNDDETCIEYRRDIEES